MSIADAITRITTLQATLASVNAPPAPVVQSVPASGAAGLTGVPGLTGGPTFAAALQQAQPLGPAAAGMLTSGQQQFAARLAAQTGLDARVIAAWMLAEQSGGAAKSREAAGNHNWLNIGYTDSKTYGAANAIWSNPIAAADATAGWLKGQDTVAGYGKAAPGVQAILQTAGQPPETQVAALQRSGWASSGYPDLPALLRQVSG